MVATDNKQQTTDSYYPIVPGGKSARDKNKAYKANDASSSFREWFYDGMINDKTLGKLSIPPTAFTGSKIFIFVDTDFVLQVHSFLFMRLNRGAIERGRGAADMHAPACDAFAIQMLQSLP